MDDFYIQRGSWIHQADPRVKLAFALASIVILLAIRELPMMLAALIGLSLLYATAHIPIRRATSIIRTILPVSVIMALLRAIFYPSGPELWAWGPISITLGGLEEGVVLVRIRFPDRAKAKLYEVENVRNLRRLVTKRRLDTWDLGLHGTPELRRIAAAYGAAIITLQGKPAAERTIGDSLLDGDRDSPPSDIIDFFDRPWSGPALSVREIGLRR